MKRSMHFRFFISMLLLLSMLTPAAALAVKGGDKHFKEGMKHEAAEEWDKAVERFALAVSENPKNPEFRLHLIRSLFNASQMYMKRGTTSAKEKDYEAAYLAFRRAYAFDPTNELAKSEMDRMVRLQQMVNDPTLGNPQGNPGGVKLLTTGYAAPPQPVVPPASQKLEKLRDLPFQNGIELQFIIKELAKDLDLNVLFESSSFGGARAARKTYIELKNVTAAQALDYIFMQEGVFFQRVGPRTILVANQTERTKFQQLVLRTFYLSNAAPKDIAKVVQTAIPAQPGRSQTIVLTDDATNSITIRDTEENIKLIGKLISSLDKDRAEVVMDVAIYEVNKNDLMQFGNQIGSQNQLTNFGGSSTGAVLFGNNPILGAITGTAAAASLPTAIATGIILPAANLQAFQSRNNTKLLASTQIHAFNNEQSEARIGQRVPVQSAQFLGVGSGTGGVNTGLGQTANVINYEQVGLTLNFKPLVFPNQDVQVEMLIESKDISGAGSLTPTFTERKIKGTARIQNNKTLLLASVAQDTESKGRAGLPLLGLIPIIGRLFTAPTRDNRQVDIVIAVTPRVIRAPAILPEDEVERSTGSMAVPTNSSLEAMLIEEERQEMLATAKRVQQTQTNANANVQLPDRPLETPEYVQTATSSSGAQTVAVNHETTAAKVVKTSGPTIKPIDTSVKGLQLDQAADTSVATNGDAEVTENTRPDSSAAAAPAMILKFGSELAEMKAGDKIRIPVQIEGNGTFASAVVGLKFDSAKLAVRTVSYGDVFGSAQTNIAAVPFINQNGKMYVSLVSRDGKEMPAAGTLAYIELEVLVAGKPEIGFDHDVINFLTVDGKNFAIKREE